MLFLDVIYVIEYLQTAAFVFQEEGIMEPFGSHRSDRVASRRLGTP